MRNTFVLMLAVVGLMACTNGKPEVQSSLDLSGFSVGTSYSVPSCPQALTISGSCDARVSSLSYSINGGMNYLPISGAGNDGNCSDETYTVLFVDACSTFGVSNGQNVQKTILFRANTMAGELPTQSAVVQFGAASTPTPTPAPTVTVDSPSVTEGSSAVFTLTLSAAASTTVTVDYATSDGTAVAGTDYSTSSGTVTFLTGQTSKTVSVSTINDSIYQGNRSFNLTLSNLNGIATSGSTLSGTGTVNDNEGQPTVSVASTSITEGSSGVVTVSLSHASKQAITVAYSTLNGTATAGTHYSTTSGILTFSPLQTSATVLLSTTSNNYRGVNRDFSLILSSPSNATLGTAGATVTIVDDEVDPVISISSSASVGEGGVMNFSVSMTGTSESPVVVDYQLVDGSAIRGVNFSGSSTGQVVITAGQTSTNLAITTIDDGLDNNDLNFTVNLTATDHYAIGAASSGTGTVQDVNPTPTLSVNDISNTEGGNLVFTVTLSANSGRTVTFDYATSNGTATAGTHYTAATGSKTISAGQNNATITVNTTADSSWSAASHAMTLTISNPVNAGISDGTGVGTIIDDDPEEVTVVAAYPTNGDKWTYFVGNNGADVFHATDVACNPSSATKYSDCVHGGEIRKFVVTTKTSCAGLTAADSLGVFDWTCFVDGGFATFYSQLKSGKGLRDLVHGSGWRSNSVTVTQSSTTIAQSSSVVGWWPNTASAVLTSSSLMSTLATPDQVYIVTDAGTGSKGVVVSASHVSVVVAPSTTLRNISNSSANFGGTDCTSGAVIGSVVCMYNASGLNFVWFEGDISAADSSNANPKIYAAYIYGNTNFLTMRNITTQKASQYGVSMLGSKSLLTGLSQSTGGLKLAGSANSIQNLTIATTNSTRDCLALNSASSNVFSGLNLTSCGGNGISLSGSSSNQFSTTKITTTNQYGVSLTSNSNSNRFDQLAVAKASFSGIYLNGSNANTFTQSAVSHGNAEGVAIVDSSSNLFYEDRIFNNANVGFAISAASNSFVGNKFIKGYIFNNTADGYSTDGDQSVLAFSTIANNGNNTAYMGLMTWASDSLFLNILLPNNDIAIALEGGNQTVFSQIAAGGSGASANSGDLYINMANDHNVYGIDFVDQLLLQGSSGNCTFGAGVGSYTNKIFGGFNCSVSGGSVSTMPTGATLRQGLNIPSALVGKVTVDSTNLLHTSGLAAYSLLNALGSISFDTTSRGWGMTGGTFPQTGNRGKCTTGSCQIWDFALKNTDLVLLGRSGNGSALNGTLNTDSAACNSALNPQARTYGASAAFLINAVEILDQAGGNNNGLCEAGESCIYQPNFGGYLGHGALSTGYCTVQVNGAGSNAKIYQYTINGY